MKSNIILKLLLACVVIVLLIFGAFQAYYKRKYGIIENEYIDAAKYIYESKIINISNGTNKVVLTRREINSLLNNMPLDKTCDGYVVIKSKEKMDFKAYITCNGKYTSKAFNKQYLE